MRTHTLILAAGLLSSLLPAQDLRPRKAPSVTMAPTQIVTSVTRGKSDTVELDFQISPGFHINSNKPNSELLIPTVLKLTAPTDIVIGRITYPPGHDMSFPFAPDEKISVYSGPFTLKVLVRPLSSVIPGRYAVHGQLKYQACDNATCFPPKVLPVDFMIKVVKSSSESIHKNPAQSPHVHR